MIYFSGHNAKTRFIELEDFGNVQISVSSLNDKLISNGDYVSEEAREIDENIFHFVEDYLIDISENELKVLLMSALQ